jgi:NAD(P)-dependent dehydrogenase (short-subunit alcohol dehydrogenase family)
VQPGFIDTDMAEDMKANPASRQMTEATMNKSLLLRRSGTAEEIANTALFLARDESGGRQSRGKRPVSFGGSTRRV